MATITTLNSGDSGPVSRGVINTNLANLNTDKAELNSPAFTGTPSLPTGTIAVTQSASDNSTKVATTAYVDNTVGFAGCRAYQNAAANISSEVALQFQLENFDTDGFHEAVTNPSRITIPTGKAGKYQIGANLSLNLGYDSQLQIRVNGSTYIARAAGGSNTGYFGCAASTIYELADGDYVEILAKGGNAGATSSGDAVTNFWLYKLG